MRTTCAWFAQGWRDARVRPGKSDQVTQCSHGGDGRAGGGGALLTATRDAMVRSPDVRALAVRE